MELIYSGFDTLTYAIKGAAEAYSLERMKLAQEKAKQEQRDMPISFTKGQLKGLITPTGMKGGYAYILKFGGDIGHVISLKKSHNRENWNAHVKIRALALAVHGWEEAMMHVQTNLIHIGFGGTQISLNRIDYAMDFLNLGIEPDPKHFVAHSRVKKSAYKLEIDANLQGQTFKGVTVGKMPNRQIIFYDKRAEAIEKRKPAWFEIWGLDPRDVTQAVHRIEIRLGKTALSKWDIRTLADMKTRLNAAMTRATQVVRYLQDTPNDKNISRWPNHPLWDHVQQHVHAHVLSNNNKVDIARVKHVIKEQKAQERRKLVIGNMGGLSVFEDMNPDTIKADMLEFIETQFRQIEADPEHPFWKSRVKTQDRFVFLGE
ncbi:MAG: hypothetical protein ABJ275_02125 [Maricaulaceae bacterium]